MTVTITNTGNRTGDLLYVVPDDGSMTPQGTKTWLMRGESETYTVPEKATRIVLEYRPGEDDEYVGHPVVVVTDPPKRKRI